MNKNIFELNIPEENKILLSKIEKKVEFLAGKTEDFFGDLVVIRSEKIEAAYSVNEDLISILNENKDLSSNLKKESFNIREIHQTDFTREVKLDVSEEISRASIIKSTIDQKDQLITADEKLFALNKRKNYIKNKNAKRKSEMNRAMEDLEERIANEQLLPIAPMKEDVKLINKYLNPREINSTRYLYLFVIIPIIFVLMIMGGAVLWTLMI